MFRKTLMLALAVALLTAGPAAADVRVVKNVEVQAPGADAATNSQVEVWIGENRARQDGNENSLIARFDKNQLIILDHGNKTYNVLQLPVDVLNMFPEEMRPQVDTMIQQAKMTVQVTPTEETKQVGDWNARKYTATITNAMGVQIDTTMWNSNDVDADVAAFKQMVNAMASMNPGGDWITEITGIEGFTVLQETTVNMMGRQMRNVEEVVSIETQDPPAGIYDPPADYQEKPFDIMEAMAGNQ